MSRRGLTMYGIDGLANKADGSAVTDGTRLGTGNQPMPQHESSLTLKPVHQAPASSSSEVQGPGGSVSSTSSTIICPAVRTDFIPVTEASVLTNVTYQFEPQDLPVQAEGGISQATVISTPASPLCPAGL